MSTQAIDGRPVPVGQRPEDEKLSPGGLLSYGLQHILSMFGGIITVPILIGNAAGLDNAGKALLLSCALFVSGLATILQSYGLPYLGSQLPLVQGISFASVSSLLAIIGQRKTEGLTAAFGACIAAGIVAFLVVPLFALIVKLFPPVVTGSIITVIGISLMPVGAKWISGQPMIAGKPNPDFGNTSDLILGVVSLLIVLALSKVKNLARMSVLLGLLIGTIIAAPFGKVAVPDFGKLSPIALPQPFAFGTPTFEFGAILSMLIVFVVVMVETTADIVAVGEVVGTDTPSRRVADGLRADMLASTVAPIFNSFPATAFAQNVGLVALTGIKSRYVVSVGGVILAVLGLSPWLAGVIGMIPYPVLGGAGLALFGSVAASGIRTLGKVNFDGNNNLLIVAVSIAFGVIPVVVPGFWGHAPEWLGKILESGISSAAIVAFLLNIFFNVLGNKDSGVHDLRAHAPARAVEHEHLKKLDAEPRTTVVERDGVTPLDGDTPAGH